METTPRSWFVPQASRAFGAVLFDLDGVLTPTADVHMAAWRRLFEDYFTRHGVLPPYTDADYYDHIDGRPRYDGVRACLASRGVVLPEGSPSDEPGLETVCGLGNAKDAAFTDTLERDGVVAFAGSVALLDALWALDVPSAVVSSSRNAGPVLAAAGLLDRFGVVVDGIVADEESLPGKPDPHTFERAAALLGVAPADAVVVEDAISGVAAGRAGGFGLVIGVDRGAGADDLKAAGADLVVQDLAELVAP